jgi:hypothetical protein
MGKDSYDLNEVQIHSNGNTNKVEDIRRNSLIDGPSKKSVSEYVSNYLHCLLH